MLKFIHGADFHLDSAFAALPPRQAAARRRETKAQHAREVAAPAVACEHDIPRAVAEQHEMIPRAQRVLDGGGVGMLGRETVFKAQHVIARNVRELGCEHALGQMAAQAYIAPGNHDWYGPGSPYLTVQWPDNVHIFTQPHLEAMAWPEKRLVLHGAAFTASEQSAGFLSGFAAPKDSNLHIGLLHGEIDPAEARYDPIWKKEIAASGLAYLALGHIHKRTEPLICGRTVCAWPGCPEGRGFDELGEKGFYAGTIDDTGKVALTFVPFARRRYEILTVDVTGQAPRAAIEAALPTETVQDLYRILLTGETGEGGAQAEALQEALADRFYALEIRDQTRLAEDLWARAAEDSLRGLFLRDLKSRLDSARTEEERQRITMAARFGLAALDHRDLG